MCACSNAILCMNQVLELYLRLSSPPRHSSITLPNRECVEVCLSTPLHPLTPTARLPARAFVRSYTVTLPVPLTITKQHQPSHARHTVPCTIDASHPHLPPPIAVNDGFEKQRRPQHQPPLFVPPILVGHSKRTFQTEGRAFSRCVVDDDPERAFPPLVPVFFRPRQIQTPVVSRREECGGGRGRSGVRLKEFVHRR